MPGVGSISTVHQQPVPARAEDLHSHVRNPPCQKEHKQQNKQLGKEHPQTAARHSHVLHYHYALIGHQHQE